MAGIESLSYQSFAATLGTYNRGQVAFDEKTQGLKLIHHHKFSSLSGEQSAQNVAIRQQFARVAIAQLGELATEDFVAQLRAQLGLAEGTQTAVPLTRRTIAAVVTEVNKRASLLTRRQVAGEMGDQTDLRRQVLNEAKSLALISPTFNKTAHYALSERATPEALAFPSEAMQQQAKAAILARLQEARALGLKGLPSSLSTHQLDNLVKGNLSRFVDGMARHLLAMTNAAINVCGSYVPLGANTLLGECEQLGRDRFTTVAAAMALRELLAETPAGELAAAARNEQDLQTAAVKFLGLIRGREMAGEPLPNGRNMLTRAEFQRVVPVRIQQFADLAQHDLAALAPKAGDALSPSCDDYFRNPARNGAKHERISVGTARLFDLLDALHEMTALHDRAFHEGQTDQAAEELLAVAERVDALLGDRETVEVMREASKAIGGETILSTAFKRLARGEHCSGHYFRDCAQAFAALHHRGQNARAVPIALGVVPEQVTEVKRQSTEGVQALVNRLPPQEAKVAGLLLGDLPTAEEMASRSNHLGEELMALRQALRSLPTPQTSFAPAPNQVAEGEALAVSVTVQGVQVTLTQQARDIVLANVGGQTFPLHLSAGNLAEAIERIFAANAQVPENFARVQQCLNEVGGFGQNFVLSPEQIGHLRALAVTAISSYCGVPISQLDGFSSQALVDLVRTWQPGTPGNTPEAMALLLKPNAADGSRIPLVNSVEILEMVDRLHQLSAEKLNEKVGYVPPAPPLNPVAGPRFSDDQIAIKELIADLFFGKETWVADAKTSPEQRAGLLRQVLLTHVDILSTVLAEPARLNRALNALPLPGDEAAQATIRGRINMLTTALTVVMAQAGFKREAGDVKPILEALIKGEEPAGIAEARGIVRAHEQKVAEAEAKRQAVAATDAWASLFAAILPVKATVALTPEELKAQTQVALFDTLAPRLDDAFFLALDGNLNTAVGEMMGSMQRAMLGAVATIFGEAEGDEEPLPALTGEELNAVPEAPADRPERVDPNQDLDTMIAEGVRGRRGQGAFIRKVLCHYFGEMGPYDQRAMLASALRNLQPMGPLLPGATEADRAAANEARMGNFLSGLLKGAGPLLQKMLQGLPEEGVPEGLRQALRDMKSNLASIPETIIKAQLLSMVERSNGQVTRIEMVESFGAASVGQTLLCRLYTPERPEGFPVAVKLLRPDVTGRMAREKALMQRAALAVGPGMLATYNGQLERVLEELDLNFEATNTERGKVYNRLAKGSTHSSVRAMRLCPLVPPTTTSLVAEVAPGTTLDKFFTASQTLAREVTGKMTAGEHALVNTYALRKDFAASARALTRQFNTAERHHARLLDLARKWVGQGVFTSGFYHGDLHAGNIMVGDEQLTVIDFGNATTLTKEQQEQISMMTVAASAGADYAGTFCHAFHQLLNPKYEALYQSVRSDLLRDLRDIFAKGGPSQSGQRIAAALLRAQEYGLELPGAVFNFSQCQMRLQNAINESNAKMGELNDALKQLLTLGKGGNTTLDPIARVMSQGDLLARALTPEARQHAIADRAKEAARLANSFFATPEVLRAHLAAETPQARVAKIHDYFEGVCRGIQHLGSTAILSVFDGRFSDEGLVEELVRPTSGIFSIWAGARGIPSAARDEAKQLFNTYGEILGLDTPAALAAVDRMDQVIAALRAAEPEAREALFAEFRAAHAELETYLAPLRRIAEAYNKLIVFRSQLDTGAARLARMTVDEANAFIDATLETVLEGYTALSECCHGQPADADIRTMIDGALGAVLQAVTPEEQAAVDGALQCYYDDVEHGGAALREAVTALRAELAKPESERAPQRLAELKTAFIRAYQSVIQEALHQLSGGLEAMQALPLYYQKLDFLTVMDNVVPQYAAETISRLGFFRGLVMSRVVTRERAAEEARAQQPANR